MSIVSYKISEFLKWLVVSRGWPPFPSCKRHRSFSFIMSFLVTPDNGVFVMVLCNRWHCCVCLQGKTISAVLLGPLNEQQGLLLRIILMHFWKTTPITFLNQEAECSGLARWPRGKGAYDSKSSDLRLIPRTHMATESEPTPQNCPLTSTPVPEQCAPSHPAYNAPHSTQQ